jgi:hypothetical protein
MRRARRAGLAATLFAASLALFWPGYAMYDTVAQYGQVLEGAFEDWHPPAMARLWAVLGGAAGAGAWPMLALQLALYWSGLGLIAGAVSRRTAAAVLLIGAWPLFLGWQGVVLKDAQMTGALLAATGLVGWWRLRGRRVSLPVVVGAGLLIAYGVLVRANAVFAAVPLAVLLAPMPPGGATRAWLVRGGATLAAMLAILALLSPINHRLLGATPSGVERTQALYDLAGIAVRSPPGAADTGLLAAEVAQIAARHCVRPYFWDPLGEADHCNGSVERLRHVPVGQVYATLADAIVHHPLAYAGQRLAHLNSTERWWVPFRWPGAAPPQASERNDEGLGNPGRPAAAWQRLAGWLAETPLGWPVAWLGLAAVGVAVALSRAASAPRDMALALLGSALCLEASFAVLSIASDLRYHLWPMIATALGTTLLYGEERRPSRRVLLVGGSVLALVVGVGAVARLVLPLPPQSYVGMLG